MVTGDLGSYIPLLRSDPLSRVAVLTMPEDSLAVLPMLQEQSDLDLLQENFSRYAESIPNAARTHHLGMSHTRRLSYSLSATSRRPSKTCKICCSFPAFTRLPLLCSTRLNIPGRGGTSRSETHSAWRFGPLICPQEAHILFSPRCPACRATHSTSLHARPNSAASSL